MTVPPAHHDPVVKTAKQSCTMRAAGRADGPLLLELIHQAFAEYIGELDPPSGAPNETLASISRLLETEHALIAEVDGQPAGCVFFAIQPDHIYMHRLAVRPVQRRLGIGRRLTAAVEEKTQACGLSRVQLGARTALIGNRLFYESMGYRIIEHCSHPGYDVITFYRMEKRLDEPVALPLPAMRRIELVPYDPTWPARFAEEAARLREIFGAELAALHHIGSTAVVGLSAKPVIDILPVVHDIRRVDRYNPWMVKLGYDPRGEYGIPGRRYFSKGSDTARTHHVHIYGQGHPEIARHVDFCAYLNAHPADAQRYAARKEALARGHPTDIRSYTDGKRALILELDAKAAAWRATQRASLSSS